MLSPESNLAALELRTAPTWAILKNVPPQLYSLDGISVVASAIGEPLHTEKSRLDPYHFGDTKVKIEITLDHPPPEAVVVRDSEGNSVRIDVAYPRLPPLCINCGKFRHLLNRCFKPLARKAHPSTQRKNKAKKMVDATTTISLQKEPEDESEIPILPVASEIESEVPIPPVNLVVPPLDPSKEVEEPTIPSSVAALKSKKRKNRRRRSRSRARGRSASKVESLPPSVPTSFHSSVTESSHLPDGDADPLLIPSDLPRFNRHLWTLRLLLRCQRTTQVRFGLQSILVGPVEP